MDIKNLKIELTKIILQTESKELLTKLHHFLTSNKSSDFYASLSEQEKKKIEIGLEQVREGETESWEDFLKKTS
jgi:hypothetical protein